MGLFSKKQQTAPALPPETVARLEHSERSVEVFHADLGTWLDALHSGRQTHGWERLTDEVLRAAGDKPTVLSTGLDHAGRVMTGARVSAYARGTVLRRVQRATVDRDGLEFWEDVQAYVADGFSWSD